MNAGLLTEKGPSAQQPIHTSPSLTGGRVGINNQWKDIMWKRELLSWIMEAELAIPRFKANLFFSVAEALRVYIFTNGK